MRPKSMATVVVVLVSTPRRSSMPTPASVRVSSVRSGRISLTAPTIVVLPTPKPPAIRILMVAGMSERLESIDHRLEEVVGRFGVVRVHQRALEQVAQEDPDGAQRQVQRGGQLRHRDRPPAQG